MVTEDKYKVISAGTVLIPKPEFLEYIKRVLKKVEFTVTKECELAGGIIGDMWMIKK